MRESFDRYLAASLAQHRAEYRRLSKIIKAEETLLALIQAELPKGQAENQEGNGDNARDVINPSGFVLIESDKDQERGIIALPVSADLDTTNALAASGNTTEHLDAGARDGV